MRTHHRLIRLLFCLALAIVLLGCDAEKPPPTQEKAPRPVSVFVLRQTDPSKYDRLPGSVASWKTEDIGFEVGGRVKYVAEPETDAEGEVHDENGTLVVPGTLLASLDDTRYRLRLRSAEAQVNTAMSRRDAALIEERQVIPAEKQAAEAELRLAELEYQRFVQLLERKATSQAEVDKARTVLDTAKAKVAGIEARRKAKQAELDSLEAAVGQYREAVAQSRKDLEDCRLIAPFHGQVAKVHVIPGGYVQQGTPVLTLQMLDPVRVDFEVSAETARILNYGDSIRVFLATEEGKETSLIGAVYMMDTIADPGTRTFTVTLLVRNRKTRKEVPEQMEGKPVVRTRFLYPALTESLEVFGRYMTEVECFRKDDEGYFLWKVLNRKAGAISAQPTRVIKVRKLRITLGNNRFSIMGIWTFRDFEVQDGQDFDPDGDLFVGELILPAGFEGPFDGDTVLLDRERWLLKPGEVVAVNLSPGHHQPGYYVPMDTVVENVGKYHVVAVMEEQEGGYRTKWIEVNAFETHDTLIRIEAAGKESLADGMQLVAAGAYYLADGERVTVTEEVEVGP